MKKKKSRRAVTLIEMLVVMTLIVIITSAVTVNYRASLEKGRAFQTEEMLKRIDTIIALSIADTSSAKLDIAANWKDIVKRSPLWNEANKEVKDAWGKDIEIQTDNNGTVTSMSAGLKKYQGK